MGLDLTTADAVLKEDYKSPVRKQINDGVGVLAQVEKNTEDIVGRYARLALQVSRNTGLGARAEGGTLPTPGNQGYVEQHVPVHYNYARIRLTKQAITRMDSDRGSFIRAVSSEMKGTVADARRDQARQVWGNSNGVIATCGVTAADTEVVLASATPESVMVFFGEGMVVDIGTVASPASVAEERTVTAVDFDNKTITISGVAVTTTSSHFVFRFGNGGALGGAGQKEVTGLQTIINDTGTLHNVDPSTYWQWASIVEDAGGTLRALSENLVEKTGMRGENRSGVVVDSMWAEDGVFRAAKDLLAAMRRIVNTTELKGGHKGISWDLAGKEVPLMKDRDAPQGRVIGIHHDSLVEFVDEDWTWEDSDGSVLHRATDETHAFTAIFYKFSEFACYRRNAHWQLQDIVAH